MINLIGKQLEYDIIIYIDISDNGNYTIHLTDKTEISYNAENFDNENAFFPSNVKISFTTDYSLNSIDISNTTLVIKQSDEIIFNGYLDYDSYNYDVEEKIYTMTFVDISSRWRFLSYQTIEEYVGNNNIISILDMLQTASGLNITNNYPPNFLTLETSQFFNGLPYISGIGRWATKPSYFFSGHYPKLIDVIKAILNSCGLLGYVRGNKFILCNKFTFSNPLTIDSNKIKSVQFGCTESYDYIVSNIRLSNGNRYDYIYDYRVDKNLGAKKQITFKHDLIVGLQPNNINWSNVWIDVPDYVAGIGYGGYYIAAFNRATFGDGLYSSLWRLLSDRLAERLRRQRGKIMLNYKGYINLFDKIIFDNKVYVVISVKNNLVSGISNVVGLSAD